MSPLAAFLRWLFPTRISGSALVVSVKPVAARTAWRDLQVAGVENAEDLIVRHRSDHDVYIAAAEFRGGRRIREHVVGKSVLTVDIDAKCFGDERDPASLDAAWRVARSLPVPSVIVSTGHGYHLHVRLPDGQRMQDGEPATRIETIEALGRALQLYTQAFAHGIVGHEVKFDAIADVSRVVRVPDSWNFKDQRNGTSGAKPSPVALARPTDPSSLGDIGTLDVGVLRPFIDEAVEQHRASHDAATAPRAPNARLSVPTALADAWPLPTGDQSGNDFRVAATCAEAGESEGAALELIRARRDALADPEDRAKGEREDYIAVTVARAYAKAAGVPRPTTTAPAPALADPGDLPIRTVAEIGGGEAPTVDWLLYGIIAKGGIHLLTGKPKEAGKTTFAIGLAGALAAGAQFLGRQTRLARTLFLYEEPDLTFKAKALEFKATGAFCLSVRDRGNLPWQDFLERVVRRGLAEGCELLVIDTFSMWTTLDADDENSSGSVREVIEPLRRAAEAGMAVLVLHHARKGDSSLADAPRGSTALAGGADVLLGLGHAPKVKRMRELVVLGRYSIEQTSIVYGRDHTGLHASTEPGFVDQRREQVLAAFRDAKEPLGPHEWEQAARIGHQEFLAIKRQLVEEGIVQEERGQDKRRRYYRLVGVDSGEEEKGDASTPLRGSTASPISPPLPVGDRESAPSTGTTASTSASDTQCTNRSSTPVLQSATREV